MKSLPPMPRTRALAILLDCDGDMIWNVEHCRSRGVPESWIEALADAHESGFDSDAQTIYVDSSPGTIAPTNQYHGIHDLKLALAIGRQLGLDVERLAAASSSRRRIVEAIRQEIEEG